MLRKNNFDLIRLALSLIVVGQHLGDLTGQPSLLWMRYVFSGSFAVQSFFVISGYLIIQSFERSTDIRDFAEKRLRRLYPGYVASVLFFGAICIGFSSYGFGELLASQKAWKYLIVNLAFLNFLQDGLPGVFTGNESQSINGALWTIKVEVMFYASVPLLVWLVRKYGDFKVLGTAFILSCVYYWVFSSAHPHPVLLRQLPGQLMYFCVGGFLYYRKAKLLKQGALALYLGLLLLVLSHYILEMAIRPWAIGLLVGYTAFCLPGIGNCCRFGDLSYGIYVVHFPIIQILVAFGVFKLRPTVGVFATLVLVILGALASWHLVEKRFLLRSSHYLKAEGVANVPLQ